MLELWIDGKPTNASNVRVVYATKGGERAEFRVQTEGEDGWFSLKQTDSLGNVASEVESWDDKGHLRRNVTLSASAPPNSVREPTRENILNWYCEAQLQGITRFLWCRHADGFDTPISLYPEDPVEHVIDHLENHRAIRVIKVFDMSKPFEDQYNEAMEE
jgi:hypothetical protein